MRPDLHAAPAAATNANATVMGQYMTHPATVSEAAM